MIELYAFVSGLRGPVGDGRLEALPLGAVTAVVGPAGGGGHDDVVRHGLVVEALLDAADAVLPVRFGERFADAEALVAAVEPRLGELEARLAEVDGCVELAVRVARGGEEPRERPARGGDYMRARLRSVTADAAAADALHAALQRCARGSVVAEPALSRLVHDASYLVRRDDVDVFAQRVASYAAAHPELDLVCTGPWAPASFAGAA